MGEPLLRAVDCNAMCGFAEDHLIFSNNFAYAEALPKKSLLSEASKCLPFPALSSFACLALLLRWCSVTPQAGFIDASARRAAAELFTAAVDICTAATSEVIFVCEVVKNFVNIWPRPQIPSGALSCRLVWENGSLDVEPLRHLACQSHICKSWCRIVDKTFGTDVVRVNLVVFLQALVQNKEAQGLAGQILARLSQLFEKTFVSLSKGTRAELKLPDTKTTVLSLEFVDCGSLKGRDQDLHCARYILACQEYMGHRRFFLVDGCWPGLPLALAEHVRRGFWSLRRPCTAECAP